jgi:CRISPR-associated protein Cas2
MTVVVTRDVAPRFRGFLASCMLEIAPGVYASPRMSQPVRTRVWAVMEEWFLELGGGSIVMTWQEPSKPAGQEVSVLGIPPITLAFHDGVFLSCRQNEQPSSPVEDKEKSQAL